MMTAAAGRNGNKDVSREMPTVCHTCQGSRGNACLCPSGGAACPALGSDVVLQATGPGEQSASPCPEGPGCLRSHPGGTGTGALRNLQDDARPDVNICVSCTLGGAHTEPTQSGIAILRACAHVGGASSRAEPENTPASRSRPAPRAPAVGMATWRDCAPANVPSPLCAVASGAQAATSPLLGLSFSQSNGAPAADGHTGPSCPVGLAVVSG